MATTATPIRLNTPKNKDANWFHLENSSHVSHTT